MPRPLKKSQDLKHPINVYFNALERAHIQARAEDLKCALSSFIRQSALNKQIKQAPQKITLDALEELARIGNNLNQLAKAVNSGKVAGLNFQTLEELREELKKIRLGMLDE